MPKKGYKQTEEHKEKLSKVRKGRITSEETKRKIRDGNRGKIVSGKTKMKMSLAKKGMYDGEKHPHWKGGKNIGTWGYTLIHQPNHPNCDVRRYVLEHRLVMEKKIKRYLNKQEVVHHIDGDKQNNQIDNLMLFENSSKHMKFERG